MAAGERLATKDPDVAQALATARLRELEQMRRDHGLHGRHARATLAAFASHHLVQKKQAGKVTDGWLELAETFLQRAVDFLGTDREMESIRVSDVRAWSAHLAQVTSHGGRTLSAGTVRHHLNALSNLLRRAQEEEVVPPGWNPVAAMMDKPVPRRLKAHWLEVPDAALFLEAARTLPGRSSDLRADLMHPLLATFLLTGGRRSEVLGLEVSDVPQLCDIVHAYLNVRTAAMVLLDAPASTLLFPSFRTGAEATLVELRKIFDRVGVRGGWKAGDIRSRSEAVVPSRAARCGAGRAPHRSSSE